MFKKLFKNIFNKEDRVKVFFPYKKPDGTFGTESLWTKRKEEYYEIDNIPFFVSNIAIGDLIEADMVDGLLWFSKFIKASGNSVIQLLILTNSSKSEIGSIFEKLGCEWEGSHKLNYLSIHIPSTLEYEIIRQVLQEGFIDEKWDYKEACLGWK